MTLVRYPWDMWLKKKKFTLVKGKDYRGMPHSMAQQIRNAAHSRNLKVSISIWDNGKIDVETTGR